MSDALVTVVVPIYNVENYLTQCVDSILNQNYKNIEVILSDDGSTDKSSLLCDEYLSKDKRVKVIHEKNAGLSEARNRGIKIAKGEYICFIDSDDYIENTYIEYLVAIINKYNCEIAICPFKRVYNDRIDSPIVKNITRSMTPRQAFDLIFVNREYVGIYAWNKLYKTELFNEISYPIRKYYEDTGTTYKLFGKSNRIGYGDVPQYYYRIGRKGAITSVSTEKQNARYLDKVEFLNQMELFFKYNPHMFSRYFYNMFLGDLFIIFAKTKENAEVNQLVKEAIDSHLSIEGVTQNLSKKVKIKYYIYRFSSTLFRLLFK